MNTTITTTLTVEEKEFIASKKWKYNELIRLGIYAKENNPQILARVKEIEETNERLANKIQSYAKRLFEIENKEMI